jgi:hypothetical protein
MRRECARDNLELYSYDSLFFRQGAAMLRCVGWRVWLRYSPASLLATEREPFAVDVLRVVGDASAVIEPSDRSFDDPARSGSNTAEGKNGRRAISRLAIWIPGGISVMLSTASKICGWCCSGRFRRTTSSRLEKATAMRPFAGMAAEATWVYG